MIIDKYIVPLYYAIRQDKKSRNCAKRAIPIRTKRIKAYTKFNSAVCIITIYTIFKTEHKLYLLNEGKWSGSMRKERLASREVNI